MSDCRVSAALEEVGSESCGTWEEGVGLDFDLGLSVASSSSQELANAMLSNNEETEVSALHESDGEEGTNESMKPFLKVKTHPSTARNNTPTNDSSSNTDSLFSFAIVIAVICHSTSDMTLSSWTSMTTATTATTATSSVIENETNEGRACD